MINNRQRPLKKYVWMVLKTNGDDDNSKLTIKKDFSLLITAQNRIYEQ